MAPKNKRPQTLPRSTGIVFHKLENLTARRDAVIDKITPELIRKIWLHYFNDYLRKCKVITEDEWRQMRRLIGEV